MKVIKAVYQTGVFVPKDVCVLPEGTEVEVTIQAAHLDPSSAADSDEQTQLLQEAGEEGQGDSIPPMTPDPLK